MKMQRRNLTFTIMTPPSRYLQMALHWAAWVKATPSQRQTFYKETIWDPEKRGAVTAEVEKIKRFNKCYIHNQQATDLVQKTLIHDAEKSTNKTLKT